MASDSSAIALHDLITSQRITAVIYVAARLGVGDCLAGGAKTSNGLAQETGAHERSLRRLLRALVTLGNCKQEEKTNLNSTQWEAIWPVALSNRSSIGLLWRAS